MNLESNAQLVAAKDLKQGMIMDWEGDKYADPHSEEPLFASEYQEVHQIDRESGCITITSASNEICGFPPDHMIKVIL